MIVLHAAPAEGQTVTGCCARPTDRLHPDDRVTHLAERVTCRPAPTVAQLLDLEAEWGIEHTGRKDEAIRQALGITPARFYVLLNRATRTREGLEHNPTLCHALLAHTTRTATVRARRVGL